MITCSRCGRENQAHYKFCLGCGAELTAAPAEAEPEEVSLPAEDDSRSVTAVPGSVTPTPAAGLPSVGVQIAKPESLAGIVPLPTNVGTGPDTATEDAQPAKTNSCAGCGTSNPKDFAFCGGCGSRLGEAAPKAEAPAAPVAQKTIGEMVLIRPDGTDGGSYDISSAGTVVGRGSGPIFDGDGYLSPDHLHISYEDEELVIEDGGSLNGVFVRIGGDEPLADGSIFRVGQELLRYDRISEPAPETDGTEIMGSPNPGYWGRLNLIVGPESDGSAFPLMGDEMVLGRERGDILFSDDGYVSGSHARISYKDGRVFLADLGSSNGTFLRISEKRSVPFGAFILVGQQLFRLDQPSS
jgi:hypothetical protein